MRYRFNLVPESCKRGRMVDLGNFSLIVVLSLYLAGLAGMGILYERKYITLQESLTRLNYQKNQLLFDERSADMILEKISRIQELEVRDRRKFNILSELVNTRILWSRTMAQITHIVPEGAWLQSVSSSGEGPSRNMVFRGMAISNQWVARLLFFLENHPDFSEVRLEYSRLAKVGAQEVYSFEVKARMTQSGGRI